jgi:hypothetical protein
MERMRGLKGGSKNRREGFWGLCTDRGEKKDNETSLSVRFASYNATLLVGPTRHPPLPSLFSILFFNRYMVGPFFFFFFIFIKIF